MTSTRLPEAARRLRGAGAQDPQHAGETPTDRCDGGPPRQTPQEAQRQALQEAQRASAGATALLHSPAVLARTASRLLHACAGAAGSTGLLCAAGALVALLLRAPGAAPATVMLALVLALLPLERLLWLRVRFDAGLFADLATRLATEPAPEHIPERTPDRPADPAADAVAGQARLPGRADTELSAGTTIDAALHALQLRGPTAAPRPLIDRALGGRRLAQRHALVALSQFTLLVSALALRFLP